MKFSSLAAPEVVILMTFVGANDENFVKMTFLFQHVEANMYFTEIVIQCLGMCLHLLNVIKSLSIFHDHSYSIHVLVMFHHCSCYIMLLYLTLPWSQLATCYLACLITITWQIVQYSCYNIIISVEWAGWLSMPWHLFSTKAYATIMMMQAGWQLTHIRGVII